MTPKASFPAFITTQGIVFIIILFIFSFFAYTSNDSSGCKNCSYTIINCDNKILKFSRIQVKPLVVKGKLGNVIVEWNRKGMIRIASSSCMGQVCVHTGWVKGNDAIVCVPNAVVVECHANTRAEIDGISR